jgi:hypothetical protein
MPLIYRQASEKVFFMPGSEQTSAKTGTTDGIKTRRSYRLDLLAITVVCVPLYGFLLVTLTSSDILYLGDGAWYLNRAHLLWRGIFDDAFVYTLVYPALIGAVNLVVQNLITAAQIVNWWNLLPGAAPFSPLHCMGSRVDNHDLRLAVFCWTAVLA